MAERYQFQYYPVTGKLTGNQMIEQTEQAINELAQNVYEGSAQVEVINTIVNQAEQNAEQALAKATQALESTGRVYIDELTAVNLNNYYNSELLYIGDETSENLPVADTGFLEVKTNDSMTNAAQVFIADSSGLLYFRQATIIPQEVGSVTTYDVTWGTWFTYATQEYVGDNYLSLAGGSITGDLSVSGTITGDLTGNADTATNATNDANGNPIAGTYLPLAGGTVTGELNAPRLNIPFDFSKGTTPSETQYAAVYFSDKDGSDYGTNCIGLIESSVNTANLSKTYMRALRNAAGSDVNCEISVNVDNSGNGYTAAPTPAQTDDSTKIATTAYVKDCVPKSVGETQRPVYTNSNGVITACTQTGDSGGLEGVSGKGGTYIRWASGFQICQGSTSATTSGKTITFPAAFHSAPRVIVCAGGYTINPGFGDVTATGVKLTSSSSSGATVYYIAIGYWK